MIEFKYKNNNIENTKYRKKHNILIDEEQHKEIKSIWKINKFKIIELIANKKIYK